LALFANGSVTIALPLNVALRQLTTEACGRQLQQCATKLKTTAHARTRCAGHELFEITFEKASLARDALSIPIAWGAGMTRTGYPEQHGVTRSNATQRSLTGERTRMVEKSVAVSRREESVVRGHTSRIGENRRALVSSFKDSDISLSQMSVAPISNAYCSLKPLLQPFLIDL
jgi:hypothetical protein